MIYDLVGKVVRAEFFNPKIRFVGIELLEDFSFNAGQFVNVEVAANFYRAYSICSPASVKGYLEFVVDITPGGKGSQFFEKLKMGDNFHFKGPFGKLILPESVDNDLYFIATGTGVAVFRAMLLDLEKAGYLLRRKVTFCWGLRFKEDIYFTEEFDGIAKKFPNFKYFVTLSRPEGWTGKCGYVTEHLGKEEFNPKTSLFFICGNMPMIEDIKILLLGRGVSSNQIFFERFF